MTGSGHVKFMAIPFFEPTCATCTVGCNVTQSLNVKGLPKFQRFFHESVDLPHLMLFRSLINDQNGIPRDTSCWKWNKLTSLQLPFNDTEKPSAAFTTLSKWDIFCESGHFYHKRRKWGNISLLARASKFTTWETYCSYVVLVKLHYAAWYSLPDTVTSSECKKPADLD